jgi:hypothetical protein
MTLHCGQGASGDGNGMDGTLLWSKALGDKTMRNQFGEASKP